MAEAAAPRETLASVTGAGFLHALEALGFGLLLLDSDLRILDASERFEGWLGMSTDELRLLKDPAPLVAVEARHEVAERRASMAAGESTTELHDVELMSKTGERVRVEVCTAAIQLTAGDGPPGLLALCRDVRQRRAVDESLSQLTTMAEVMPVGLIVWDAQGVTDPMAMTLAGANAGAERMLGVELYGRLGGTVGEIFPDADPVATARLLALAGTDRMEDFGDAQYAAGIFRWQAAGLPGSSVGVLFEDVTRERTAEWERRRLLERLVDTGDDERRRLAIAMHDDPVQKIAAATLLVEALRRHPAAVPPAERLGTIEGTLRSAMATLRRLTFELSPPELAESGLEAAVATASTHLFEDTPVNVEVEVDLADEPVSSVQTAAFRIVAEALTNARKHADPSRVEVRIADRDGLLSIEVRDDGRGFDPDVGESPGHIGLRTMRERAAAVGGSLHVQGIPGQASVTARLPLDGRDGVVPIASPSAADLEPLGDAVSLRAERDSLRASVAAALDRAQRAEGRLRDAFALTKTLLDPGLTRDQIATIAVEHLGTAVRDGCALHLVDRDGTLHTLAAWHVDAADTAALDLDLLTAGAAGGHVGTVLRSGEPLALDRASLVVSAGSVDPRLARVHAAVVAPLKADDEVIGVVTLVRDRTPSGYDDSDIEFLMCLVDRVAIALSVIDGQTT